MQATAPTRPPRSACRRRTGRRRRPRCWAPWSTGATSAAPSQRRSPCGQVIRKTTWAFARSLTRPSLDLVPVTGLTGRYGAAQAMRVPTGVIAYHFLCSWQNRWRISGGSCDRSAGGAGSGCAAKPGPAAAVRPGSGRLAERAADVGGERPLIQHPSALLAPGRCAAHACCMRVMSWEDSVDMLCCDARCVCHCEVHRPCHHTLCFIGHPSSMHAAS